MPIAYTETCMNSASTQRLSDIFLILVQVRFKAVAPNCNQLPIVAFCLVYPMCSACIINREEAGLSYL